MKTVMHGQPCVLHRFKSQRCMFKPCARSLKVSDILTGRECRLDVLKPQLRCLIPVEWAGPCFTWEGTWGGGRVHRQLRICRPGLYYPSGKCLLSKPSPDLPWHYTVLRAYKSPEGRGDGKSGMDQPV